MKRPARYTHRPVIRDMPSGEPALSIPPTRWSVDELIPFGKYILLNKISAGATAAVYRAKVRGEAGFERLVTIKRILPQMAGDPEFVETFVREAKVCARLSHSNICPIYELGKVGESLYMALEWVSGKDLRAIMRRLQTTDRVMPKVAAAWIASRLCDALDYAHGLKDAKGERLGILHQDLSPANIVVSYEGDVKLLDFGIARATGRAQQTNVDALKQKLGYMSPELVLGTPVDRRSDLFGVGVCLYEMVTGKRLFAGSDDIATLKLLRNATVPKPSELCADTPEELELIIMRALARDPEARWPSAGEMAHALTAFAAATDPTFSTRNLAELMLELFEQDKQVEQSKLNDLLAASHDARLMEQRRRFFASPLGAAAIAKAEATRRHTTSTRPPANSAVAAAGGASGTTPNAEPSVTDSHISERRSRAPAPSSVAAGASVPATHAGEAVQRAPEPSNGAPDAPDAPDAQKEADDDALTTFRPPVLETPRPGDVARDGLTTAATYDELIRRSAETADDAQTADDDEAENTLYRPEPSLRSGPASAALSGPAAAGSSAQTAITRANQLPADLSLLDLQNEQTVYELDPGEYEPMAGDQDPPSDPPGPEVAVDFESEATNFLGGAGQPAAALALFETDGVEPEHDEEATHIFFSAESGLGLPDVPDDELTTVAPPTPLRVPPPAGQRTNSGVPVRSARPNTGAHHLPVSPTQQATRSAPASPGSRLPTLPTLVSSSFPPRGQRGPLLWVVAAAALVTLLGLVLKTPLGITLGLRKPPTGTIEVRTTPAAPAAVRLDGIYRGRTPLRLEGVPAGLRVLALQADGYEPATRSVTLEGGTVLHEDITLHATAPTPTAPPTPVATP